MYNISYNVATLCPYKCDILSFKHELEKHGISNLEITGDKIIVDKKPLYCYNICGYKSLTYTDIKTLSYVSKLFLSIFVKEYLIGINLSIKNLSNNRGVLIDIKNEKEVEDFIEFELDKKRSHLNL